MGLKAILIYLRAKKVFVTSTNAQFGRK